MNRMPRGSRPRTISAIVLLTLLAGVSTAILWPRPDADAEAGSTHAAHASAEALDARVAGPSVVNPPETESAGDIPQTSLAAAAGSDPASVVGPGAASAPAAPAAPAASRPVDPGGPTRDGAAGLGRPRPDVDPKDVFRPNATIGGCLQSYGGAGQCLPIIPPSWSAHAAAMLRAGRDPLSMAHPWTCREVRDLFPEGIEVRVAGTDPLGLDADGDAIACEPD